MTRFSDLKVGDTPLLEVPQLSGRYGARVLVKDESANPYGTFKDRRNHYILTRDHATRNILPVYYIQITSGNSGFSMARMCQAYSGEFGYQRHAINLVGKDVTRSVRRELEKCSIVKEVDLSREVLTYPRLLAIGREVVGRRGDVRLVEQEGSNGDGYGAIVDELHAELDDIDYVFCPVGEGELMTKLALGLRESSRIVGTTSRANIYAHPGEDFISSPGTSAANKLDSGYSDFRTRLLGLCDTYGHEILVASDDDIRSEHALLRALGIRAEPSAAAAFAGAKQYTRTHSFAPDDTVVIINTGDGALGGERHRYELTQNLRRRASRVGAPLAFALLTIGMPFYAHDTLTQEQALWKKWRIEGAGNFWRYELGKLDEEPELKDMIAYAAMRAAEKGHHGEIDGVVLGMLENYFIYSDGFAREWYRTSKEYQRTVADFRKWSDKQAHADSVRDAEHAAWLAECARNDSLKASSEKVQN